MPLVTDYKAVSDVYQDCAERGVALAVFCAEDRETLESILAAVLEFGEKIGVDDLPIIPAWTSRYPGRGQMTLLTACANPVLGTQLMLSDLAAFMGETSPYRKLRVMPHLDHAFPWLDGDILDGFVDKFASVMCDASEKPFEENVRLTADYVERVRGKVVVEGAVDEVYHAGGANKNEPTTVEQAKDFLDRTGADVIVPNVGTEHRASGAGAKYLSERAREISGAVGKILCLHGTSSVKEEDLSKLASDGFIKINTYTTLAIHGGQAIARKVLNNVGNIFDEAELSQLVSDGVLGAEVLDPGFGETDLPIGPKLVSTANPPRRDVWSRAVRGRCCHFLDVLNYRLLAK